VASKFPGHVSLNFNEYILVDKTYRKQLQTAFNPRFSTGDPSYGDLSFFQFLAMEDFSGGNGQEIFNINNRFAESEGIDVTTKEEFKLAPKIEKVADVNGPQHEHLNEPVENEDAWPQVIEWLGKAVFYNDRIEFDSGGTEFLEVFETEIVKDKILNKDTSGLPSTVSNDIKAKITNISKTSGLPGDTLTVTVEFGSNSDVSKRIRLDTIEGNILPYAPGFPNYLDASYDVDFRLYFGGDAEEQTKNFASQVLSFERAFVTQARKHPYVIQQDLIKSVTVDFTVKVPEIASGVYKLWTAVGHPGFLYPATKSNAVIGGSSTVTATGQDPDANASVQFFIESIDGVTVIRKDLYAPQLKAAAISGSKLIGGRVFDGTGYIEVYEEQNDAVDRTLQISLSDAGATPTVPTYMEMISSKGVIIVALNNRIYSVDIETDGLTDVQRMTFIGTVAGDYVSGMAHWDQRIYIASFDKSAFTSHISWTDGEEIADSYDIDGKFWVRDIANFRGGLFYCGGTQDGEGRIVAFPSEPLMEINHPSFDNAIRTLNAGRKLYAGWSHGTGLLTITERGVSTWARLDLGEDSTNIVWDVEEVGATVFILANSGVFKTTNRYTESGFLETSKMGGNTPLIKKEWYSVTIETKEMSGAHKVRVLATHSELTGNQWLMLGEMGMSDGTEKTFFFPEQSQAQWAQIRIELSTTDDTTTPVIKRVTTKYFPSSLNKLQWGLAIRADDNMKFLNNFPETRSATTILSDIFDLRNVGKIKFRDIDETEYDVLVTDIKQESPLINKRDGLEGIVSLELLEA